MYPDNYHLGTCVTDNPFQANQSSVTEALSDEAHSIFATM